VSFDRIAPWYDWAERCTAGPLLQRARVTWLDDLADRRHVLSAGEGHGRFAAALRQKYPDTALTCLEQSRGMAAVADRRLARAGTTTCWIHDDATRWVPTPASYDAIATHFFLDCFDPATLSDVIARLADAATDDAVWLVTDFALPPAGPRRWRAAVMHAVMYRCFRWATDLRTDRLTPPDDDLRARGFVLRHRREYSWGLVRADVWQRATVRAIGSCKHTSGI